MEKRDSKEIIHVDGHTVFFYENILPSCKARVASAVTFVCFTNVKYVVSIYCNVFKALKFALLPYFNPYGLSLALDKAIIYYQRDLTEKLVLIEFFFASSCSVVPCMFASRLSGVWMVN